MARYIGDLTDPKNSEERERATMLLEQVAVAVRNRKVSHLDITWDRNLINPDELGVPGPTSDWTINIKAAPRGRHQKQLGGN